MLQFFFTLFSILFMFFLRQTFSMQTEEFSIIYAGEVTPPGNYKIVIWDDRRKNTAVKCSSIFEHIIKKDYKLNSITRSYDVAEVKLNYLKYKTGINLEDLSDCFVHFYSIQTNVDGEFEIKMSSNVNDKIYVHIFPLDKQRNFFPSTNEPGTVLQNKMKREKWKHLSGQKDILFMFHFIEYEQRVSKWLDKWLTQNAVPTEEEAFFIKAFFRCATEKIVEQFTKMTKIYRHHFYVVEYYGAAFNNCLLTNGERNLAQKLAQINGMPNSVKFFCQFLAYGFMEDGKQRQNDIKIELPEWKKFCKNYMDKRGPRKSLLISNNSNSN